MVEKEKKALVMKPHMVMVFVGYLFLRFCGTIIRKRVREGEREGERERERERDRQTDRQTDRERGGRNERKQR